MHRPASPRLFGRGSWPEARRIADILRKETIGGVLLLAGAVVALDLGELALGRRRTRRCAASPFGPAALHLDLTLATWAADGLLAIFFFVAGLELKREFVAGDLRDPRRAAVPVAAAVGGVIVPAVLYAADQPRLRRRRQGLGDPDRHRHRVRAGRARGDRPLPAARAADVPAHPGGGRRPARDHHHRRLLHRRPVGRCRCWARWSPLAAFTVLVQRRVRSWWLLLPLAFAAWALVHASGVHATVAGVLLGFAVPVLRSRAAGGPDAGPGPGRALRAPLPADLRRRRRAGLRVDVAPGSPIGGLSGLGSALTDPVAVGIIVGLVARQADRHHRARPGWSPASPGRSWTPGWPGSTCSAWPCWPASGSPCRC